MSIQQLLLGASGASGYNIDKSLRFRASASANLNRTPASAGNRQTWTWSGWVKRGALGGTATFFAGSDGSASSDAIFFSSDSLAYFQAAVGSVRVSTAVFRDPSAWYHIVAVSDTTNATAQNRFRIYINGVEITAWTTNVTITQNRVGFINANTLQRIGCNTGLTQFFDGYMAEVNFIGGQALTPASFGEYNALTGVWQPKAYTGTYGTNGFYLDFENTTSVAALGTDKSGNGNTWTVNNISLTAGVTFDSMTDVPTLTSATAANYAVLNPIVTAAFTGGAVINNGNLRVIGTNGVFNTFARSTMAISGKMYAEFFFDVVSSAASIGVAPVNDTAANGGLYVQSTNICYRSGGNKRVLGTESAYGASYAANNIIGVAVDTVANTVEFFKNGVTQGVITSSSFFAQGACLFAIATDDVGSPIGNANFGQRPFTYTPPTGFLALNTFNLPNSTVVEGSEYFDATLYTGTLLSNTITNAYGFQPDLVWIKSRSAATDHELTDSVRGVTKSLTSNSTAAEATDIQGLTAFNSGGFTVGTNTNYNNMAATYVAWQWKAGGAAVSNTAGSITSQVSANASAGFSIVTYTGTGTNATVGHGLGVAPSLIIAKRRNSTSNWVVYHQSIGNTQGLFLNGTNAATTSSVFWNNTSPTSSVFTLGGGNEINVSSTTNVAYCWSEIAGFSKFGSYVGNGSTDGTFLHTGFRPKFILWKNINDGTSLWEMFDSSRDTYNVASGIIYSNLSNAEASSATLDFLSNGVKFRAGNRDVNNNGTTYIYAAYAENPFKNSLAR